MDAGSGSLQEEHEQKREVTILMTAIKHKGLFMKSFVQVLHFLLGSNAAMGWSMHWTIRVDDSCFELRRHATAPYTQLAFTPWETSRIGHVLYQLKVGYTAWTDEQIQEYGKLASITSLTNAVQAGGDSPPQIVCLEGCVTDFSITGTTYFEREANARYDLYMNNCQTFVYSVAQQICADSLPTDRHLGIPLAHIISFTVSRLCTIVTLPLCRLYYSYKGCDRTVLREYEAYFQFWAYWMLPVFMHTPLAVSLLIPSMLQDMVTDKKTVDSAVLRYVSAILASVVMFGNLWVLPLSTIPATLPKPTRDPIYGKWRLRERPQQLQTMNAGGTVSLTDLGPEPEMDMLARDPNNVIEGGNRWRNRENEKIPEWCWRVAYVAGAMMACSYWLYILSKSMLKRAFRVASFRRGQHEF